MWLLWLLSCVLPACRDLCAAKADCLEAEMLEFGADWPSWTGFADRDAYEAACFEVFEAGLDEGASRRDQRRICRAEDEAVCGG
jgi:hypothetical protein